MVYDKWLEFSTGTSKFFAISHSNIELAFLYDSIFDFHSPKGEILVTLTVKLRRTM